MKAQVAIIMGSKTDYKVMKLAEEALENFGITFKTEIVSAHRTPEKMMEFGRTAHEKGFKVIIAGAGFAAHLPGMVAALTPLPVIGVPILLGKLKGIDALLSIQQMPKGIPVATVAIDNAFNAGVLAARILGVSVEKIQKQLLTYKKQNEKLVKKMNRELF
jgi:5-(carboxyamino)imidazole ribonucleotide mutase